MTFSKKSYLNSKRIACYCRVSTSDQFVSLTEKIGRKKVRDSKLIRKLLKSGLTFRAISEIAKCSHGSVHQEKLALKREEEAERLRLLNLEKEVEAMNDSQIVFPAVS